MLRFLRQRGRLRAAAPRRSRGAASAAGSRIAAENALPGADSSEWDVNGCGDPAIQGFATRMSLTPGETLELKVQTEAADYRVDIYRLGYYGGKGARKVGEVRPCAALPQQQPPPHTEPATGLVDCGSWAVSARWAVPPDAVSGVYIARLTIPGPSLGWRQDNTQTAGGAWMTGAPPGDDDEAAAGETRLPSHDLDDEALPVPHQPGWEHSYGTSTRFKAALLPIQIGDCASMFHSIRYSQPERADCRHERRLGAAAEPDLRAARLARLLCRARAAGGPGRDRHANQRPPCSHLNVISS